MAALENTKGRPPFGTDLFVLLNDLDGPLADPGVYDKSSTAPSVNSEAKHQSSNHPQVEHGRAKVSHSMWFDGVENC